jgi:transcription elongation factor GreA
MVEVKNSYTVERAAVEYLGSLYSDKRSLDEPAVQKFVRWIGRQKSTQDITTRDVDAFSKAALSGEGAALRRFLSYTYKRGLTIRGLASRVKSAKEPKGPAQSGAQVAPVHVTPEGLAQLKGELDGLLEERASVTDQIRRAAADKDFRENAPLHAAREQKSHIEGRILEIQGVLSAASLVEVNAHGNHVGLGDTVILTDLSHGRSVTYQLVHSREASAKNGKLSAASPIGQAILGKRDGQEFDFKAPGGTFRYRVERVQAPEKA